VAWRSVAALTAAAAMGCASSSPSKYEDKGGAGGGGADNRHASSSKAKSDKGGGKKSGSGQPDFGLATTHEVIKLLGRGGEGETWLVKDKETGEEVAAKLIKRPIPKAALAVIKREIKIQSDLGQGHLNLVSADEVILSKTHLGLVMEYVPGGNMVQFVTKRRETKAERGGLCLDEDEARYYFLQLLSAVEYCHKHHVAHRDLVREGGLCMVGMRAMQVLRNRSCRRPFSPHTCPPRFLCLPFACLHASARNRLPQQLPCPPSLPAPASCNPSLPPQKLDNTLLTQHRPPWIKLCDFGFAKHWLQTSNMNTMRIGTPEYMGPELISSRTGYDGVKVDVWAAGVLLYVMLVGVFPFETQDDNFSNTAGLYDIWLQQIKTSWREVRMCAWRRMQRLLY